MLKIKICGITNLTDALLSIELGADALGFIFYPPSPRYIDPVKAEMITRQLPPLVTTVGVFVNPALAEITEVAQRTGIMTVQLHGSEEPEFCQKIHLPVIKAFRVSHDFQLDELEKFKVQGYLLDSFSKQALGGTGQRFDWEIARAAQKNRNIILAGGINPDNIIQAIEMVHPYGIDVCSGVESIPGKKDKRKLRSLFKKVNRIRYEKTI
ncbi:MAG: phosphoribosylanthranilate isomerase [candidate division KSB1 bacterium]|nr:phosphoribosylanthranilate isomerase [candidate division KSB1 bacterium]